MEKQLIRKTVAIIMVDEHNNKIDNFINNELPRRMGLKDGKMKLQQWFKAATIIQEQGFYEEGMKLLNGLRDDGHDVKMDMQSNKLVIM